MRRAAGPFRLLLPGMPDTNTSMVPGDTMYFASILAGISVWFIVVLVSSVLPKKKTVSEWKWRSVRVRAKEGSPALARVGDMDSRTGISAQPL